jgi:hypothetical protein
MNFNKCQTLIFLESYREFTNIILLPLSPGNMISPNHERNKIHFVPDRLFPE